MPQGMIIIASKNTAKKVKHVIKENDKYSGFDVWIHVMETNKFRIIGCGDMVSCSSRERHISAIDAPENVKGYHLDWMFTRHDLGHHLAWGREFSVCEQAGPKIENDKKVLDNTLK
ncbi:9976_t:CDS:2, partial [Entrophospora sp. SA101]